MGTRISQPLLKERYPTSSGLCRGIVSFQVNAKNMITFNGKANFLTSKPSLSAQFLRDVIQYQPRRNCNDRANESSLLRFPAGETKAGSSDLLTPLIGETNWSLSDIPPLRYAAGMTAPNFEFKKPCYPIFVCVDGLISSGKSTLLSNLKKRGFTTYPEPLYEWKDQLKRFYDNPKGEFLNTQSLVLESQTRLKQKLLSVAPTENRSIAGEFNSGKNVDKYIFVERNHISQLYFIHTALELNTLSIEEGKSFIKLWKKTVWLPDVIIHMSTPVTTCFQRLQTRNQVGDHAVSLEYLKLLDKNYKQVYDQMKINKHYNCLYYNSVEAHKNPDFYIDKLLNSLP